MNYISQYCCISNFASIMWCSLIHLFSYHLHWSHIYPYVESDQIKATFILQFNMWLHALYVVSSASDSDLFIRHYSKTENTI